MSTVETMTLWEHAEAMASALEPLEVERPGLQILPYLNTNPTVPSIDIYPGSPFQAGAAFGFGEVQVFWTVRARVSTADQKSGYQLLLRLMDPNDELSVEKLLWEADYVMFGNEGVSEFREYPGGDDGAYLGCEWRVSHFL